MGKPNKPPEPDERNNVSGMRPETRAMIMYSYLTQRKNMDTIARELGVSGSQPGQIISSVMRVYGFGNNNQNKFGGGRYGYLRPELEDFIELVKTYPYGCEYDIEGSQVIEFFQQRNDKIEG